MLQALRRCGVAGGEQVVLHRLACIADIVFVWWWGGGGGVCKVIFVSNPSKLRLSWVLDIYFIRSCLHLLENVYISLTDTVMHNFVLVLNTVCTLVCFRLIPYKVCSKNCESEPILTISCGLWCACQGYYKQRRQKEILNLANPEEASYKIVERP